jgi:hydroxymethylbilane synthase
MRSDIPSILKLGTRGSALARWQTDHVSQLLRDAWRELTIEVQVLTTQGDRILETPLPMIGGKGVFTAELEAALRERDIDLAIHSLKDLPTENSPGLILGAIPARATPQDVLISRRSYRLNTLPQGARVGTSSLRRAAQLLHRRSDLQIADIRGNVDTRIRKALDPQGNYDAVILAAAGVERLGQADMISDYFSLDDMLPAPGQGALAVQCRDENQARALLAAINHIQSEIAVTAERAFLAGLGGGCSLPIAAYGVVEDQQLHLRGRVTAPDGSKQVDVHLDGTAGIVAARQLGQDLARIALSQGVASLLEMLSEDKARWPEGNE